MDFVQLTTVSCIRTSRGREWGWSLDARMQNGIAMMCEPEEASTR
jgi:hypothetical protein